MIGIICAEKEEIFEVLKLIKNKKEEKFSIFNFITGKLNNQDCVVVLSGVGKVNSAICTQSLILKYNPDFILNIGVAGGIIKEVKIGDIIIATHVVQYDFDISILNRKKGEIPGLNIIKIPCSNNYKKIVDSCKNIKNINVFTGIIATGDQFVNSSKKINEIRNEFNAVACDMEAGSIGQTCFLNNINFCIIRSISDGADSQAEINFKEFIVKASRNAAEVLKMSL